MSVNKNSYVSIVVIYVDREGIINELHLFRLQVLMLRAYLHNYTGFGRV